MDIEQIIPMKDAEEYMISMAEKTQEDIASQEETKSRHIIRLEFWKILLEEINGKSNLFQNSSPSNDNWIAAGSGISGISYNLVVTGTCARVELFISRSETNENKFIFDELLKIKNQIESDFRGALEWQRLDNKKASRIKHELIDVSVFNRDNWPKMVTYMIDTLIKMEKAMKEPLKNAGKLLKVKG